MAKKKTQPELKQYEVKMRLEFDVTALVEAYSDEEALAKAKDADLDDDGLSGGSLINWEVRSNPVECR